MTHRWSIDFHFFSVWLILCFSTPIRRYFRCTLQGFAFVFPTPISHRMTYDTTNLSLRLPCSNRCFFRIVVRTNTILFAQLLQGSICLPDKYLRRFSREYLPADKYLRSFSSEYLPADKYLRRFSKKYLPAEKYLRSFSKKYCICFQTNICAGFPESICLPDKYLHRLSKTYLPADKYLRCFSRKYLLPDKYLRRFSREYLPARQIANNVFVQGVKLYLN